MEVRKRRDQARTKRRIENPRRLGAQRRRPDSQGPALQSSGRTVAQLPALPPQLPSLPEGQGIKDQRSARDRDVRREKASKPCSKAQKLREANSFKHLLRASGLQGLVADKRRKKRFKWPDSLSRVIEWYAMDYYCARGLVCEPKARARKRQASEIVKVPASLFPYRKMGATMATTLPGKQNDSEYTPSNDPGITVKRKKRRGTASRNGKPIDMTGKLSVSAMTAIRTYVEFSVEELLGDHATAAI